MRIRIVVLLAIVAVATGWVRLRADGNEMLGTPSIPIASGTGVVSGGTGMITQPGSITLDVPNGSVVVKQVLLYWEGFSVDGVGDNSITVAKGGSSTSVVGTLIGGPTLIVDNPPGSDPDIWASTYRADITSLGLVTKGSNTLTLSGLSFSRNNNGAGIIVIFDDGSSPGGIQIRDGSDFAYHSLAPPLNATVAQSFSFSSSTTDRTALLNLFFSSVVGTASGGGFRPTSIEVTTNGLNGATTIFSDALDSVDGQEFDHFEVAVDIPAGATQLTVQAFSREDNNSGQDPASFDWLAAAFSIEAEPTGATGRMTGGGSVFTAEGERVTHGFEIHCDLREPNNIEVNWPGGNNFHLTELTGALCTDSPAIDQNPPVAPFDTFIGTGTGKLNNVDGARIEFVFVDAGEPGTLDTVSIQVFDENNNLVLDVSGPLDRGNQQAHRDNK
jgi:hypothetical protein